MGCPEGHAQVYPATSVRVSRSVKARTATGAVVASIGRKRVLYEFEDGSQGTVHYAAIKELVRPVMSVGVLNQQGATVVFAPSEAYILKAGQRLELVRRGDVFFISWHT